MPIFTAIGTAVAVGIGATAAVGTAAATGAAVAGGLALTTAGTFIAGATAFGLQMVTGVGLSMLASQIAGQPSQVTPETLSGAGFGITGTLQAGGDVPRSFPVGPAYVDGSLVWANTWKLNENQTTPNPYLTQVIALSDWPLKRGGGDGSLHIHALKGLLVNGERVTIDTAHPHATLGYPIVEYTGEDEFLWIRFYDGTQTTADSLCVNKASSGLRPYESTRVGTGVAYAVVTAKVNPKKFTGFPRYGFETYGIRLYDITRDSTAGGSGAQRWNDQATWGGDGDDYPAVQAYNLARGLFYDGEWFYGLQRVTAARLPAANWIAQIGKCRASIDSGEGGSPPAMEPTYRCALEIAVNNEIGKAFDVMMTACQGRMAEIGGTFKLHLGAPDAAVTSITDSDILSTEEDSFRPILGLSDTITGVAGKYPEPDEAWSLKPLPPIHRSDLEEAAGDRRLMSDVTLTGVPFARQAQQLMQEGLNEAQRARRHTFSLPPKFSGLEPAVDFLTFPSARNGYAETKTFRVDGVVDKDNCDVLVDLTEVDPADYDWETGADYVPPVIGPTDIVRPASQPVLGASATPSSITDDSGDSERPAITIEWDATDVVDVDAIEIQVRKASDEEVVYSARIEEVGVETAIVSTGLLPNTEYEWRVRYIAQLRETEWTNWASVTTLDIKLSLPDLDDETQALITIGGNQLLPESLLFEIRYVNRLVAGMLMAQAEQAKKALREGNLFADGFDTSTYIANASGTTATTINTGQTLNVSRIRQDSDSDGLLDWVIQPTTGAINMISAGTGTVIHNTVTNAANAFDGLKAKGSPQFTKSGLSNSSAPILIGKDYGGSPKSINKAIVYPATGGMNSAGNSGTVELQLRASQTDPGTNPVAGEVIGNVITTTGIQTKAQTITVASRWFFTSWRYVWIVIKGVNNGAGGASFTMRGTEIEFYENAVINNMTLTSRFSGTADGIPLPSNVGSVRMHVELQMVDETVVPGMDFSVEFSANNGASWSSFDSEDLVDIVLSKSNTQFTSVTASNANSSFTFAGGDPYSEGFREGQLILWSNLSVGGNNKIFNIVSFDGTSNRTVIVDPAPTDMTADSAFTVEVVNRGITDITGAGPIRIFRTRFTPPDSGKEGAQLMYRIKTLTNKMIRVRRVLMDWLYSTVTY